jgi:hypothetical protein
MLLTTKLQTLLVAGCVFWMAMGCAPAAAPTPASPVGSFNYTNGLGEKEQLVLLADQTWTFGISVGPNAGLLAVGGTYKVTGEQIAFTVNQIKGFTCAASQAPGVYKWSSDGKTLTFTTVTDGCADRVVVLTTGVWQKQ